MLSSLILSLAMSATPTPSADTNAIEITEAGTKRTQVRIGTKRTQVRINTCLLYTSPSPRD